MSPARGADLSSVAVVIPCFRSSRTIRGVIDAVPPEVGWIICVDDASDDDLQDVLGRIRADDPRVRVAHRERNEGVGAATIDGYRIALAEGARVIVKLDSDGQMDPSLIPSLVAPILAGEADYVKGNRFFDIDDVRGMPPRRLVGNAGLSFLSKLSTGYWDLFDFTNGFTAIHATVADALPLERLHRRYFFESDLLFRLGTLRARVVELPMAAAYGDETSHLSELNSLLTFPGLHARNLIKRIFYNYFLRGFSVASVNLLASLVLIAFGASFGASAWLESARSGAPATAGTVMLSAMPLLIGIQLLVGFLQHDVSVTPQSAIHGRLPPGGRRGAGRDADAAGS